NVLLLVEADPGAGAKERPEQRPRLLGGKRRLLQLDQVAVQAQHRGIPGDEVKVGGAGLDGTGQPVTEPGPNGKLLAVRLAHVAPLAVAVPRLSTAHCVRQRRQRQANRRVVPFVPAPSITSGNGLPRDLPMPRFLCCLMLLLLAVP